MPLQHLAFPQRSKPACRAAPKCPPSALFFPSLSAVAQSDALRVLWRIVLRLVVQKVRKTEAVAVLRFREGEGGAGEAASPGRNDHRVVPPCAPQVRATFLMQKLTKINLPFKSSIWLPHDSKISDLMGYDQSSGGKICQG